MSFHLFFINGWGFESNFWKPTCDLLNFKDIVSSAEILDKNSLNKKAPKKNSHEHNIYNAFYGSQLFFRNEC